MNMYYALHFSHGIPLLPTFTHTHTHTHIHTHTRRKVSLLTAFDLFLSNICSSQNFIFLAFILFLKGFGEGRGEGKAEGGMILLSLSLPANHSEGHFR